jgi:nucleoside-diphosphate-sugar epimerase
MPYLIRLRGWQHTSRATLKEEILPSARHPIIEQDLKTIVSTSVPWDRLYKKTVLISGANGFVPAYMLETLLYLNETAGADIHVVALVRNFEKAMRRFGHLAGRKDLTMVVQDVRDPYGGPKEVNFIVHAASQASPRFFGSDPVGTFETNVIGTQRMLQIARNAESEAFLFFSSGEIYGRIEDPSVPITEASYRYLDPIDLRSCYAEGKRAGETLCACWHAQFGVPARIVRLSHTYGPGMDLGDGRVFADFVADIVAERDIVLKSDGSARRPFCYLSDATVAFFKVLLEGNSGEAYNVGSDTECSVLDLAMMLCELFPERKCRVIRQERKPGDPYIISPVTGGHFDLSKIRSLGWEPTTGLEEGFTRTVKSYEVP